MKARWFLSFLSAIVSFSLSVLNPRIALAENGISLSARAEAGIDPATRQYIATLPSVWQPQLQKIFDEAMNRVDKSVTLYLGAVEVTLSNVMSDAKCAMVGTSKQVVDDIVGRFPWVGTKEPFADLRKEISAVNGQRRYSNSPTEIKDKYNQVQLLTTVVKCQFDRIVTAQYDLNIIMDTYNQKWLVWNRLESLHCSDGDSCITKYKTLVEAQVHTTDPDELKDVKETHGDENFAKFKAPDGPGFFSYWTKSYDYDAFEGALMELYNIENAIYLARARRLTTADKRLTSARAEFDMGDSLLEHECYVLSGSPGQPTDGDYKDAAKRVPIIAGRLNNASSLAGETIVVDGAHRTQVIALQNQIGNDNKRLNTLKDVAAHEYLAIAPHDCR